MNYSLLVAIAVAFSSPTSPDPSKLLEFHRYLESSTKRAFDLRPVSAGFESTDMFDLKVKLATVNTLLKMMEDAKLKTEFSDAEKMSLGIFDAKIKNMEDLKKHYYELQKALMVSQANENMRIARNISLRWIQSALSTSPIIPFKSTDSIEILLSGELSSKILNDQIEVLAYVSPLPGDQARASVKEPLSLEQNIEKVTTAFIDLETEEVDLSINLTNAPTPKSESADFSTHWTTLKIFAPEAGWPKDSALVLFVRDSLKTPPPLVPVRAFFKTFVVGKD